MTPEERRLRAQKAAHSRWARPYARQEQAEAARAALWRHFEAKVDPEGVLPPEERRRCAESAMKAQIASARLAQRRLRTAGDSDPPSAA